VAFVQSVMTQGPTRRFVTPFILSVLASTFLFAQNAQQNAADAERVITALEIRAGSDRAFMVVARRPVVECPQQTVRD
jgi:hypothetical protein